MNAIIALGLRFLLLLLAYAFVGWIGFLIYQDLKNTRSTGINIEVPTLSLSTQIKKEPVTKQFHNPEIIIGRDPTSDFPVLDEAISLQHCRLFFQQRHWWIEDLDSTNGTFVNEDPVETPVVLVKGDGIRLGRMHIDVNIHE